MNDEQLEILADAVELKDIAYPDDKRAAAAAVADMNAMRTKIDADALDEAGWVFDHDEEAWRRSWFAGSIFVEMDGANPIVEVVWDNGEGHNHVPFTHVRTMYDLAELHRLLAGAQANAQ